MTILSHPRRPFINRHTLFYHLLISLVMTFLVFPIFLKSLLPKMHCFSNNSLISVVSVRRANVSVRRANVSMRRADVNMRQTPVFFNNLRNISTSATQLMMPPLRRLLLSPTIPPPKLYVNVRSVLPLMRKTPVFSKNLRNISTNPATQLTLPPLRRLLPPP